MSQSAAFMVLDTYPSPDEIDELVYAHLDEIDEDEVEASVEIMEKAPDWLSICEQDQINAHLRDGGVCVLVLYITVGESTPDDDY
jgi:hypothetical protein